MAIQATDNKTFLKWQDRPPEVNTRIQKVFDELVLDKKSNWGLYNGSEEYDLLGIKEYQLMETIIRDSSTDRTDFYAMDIGGGNFLWGTGLVNYINKLNNLRKNITVHIINLRAETYLRDRIFEKDRCKIYNLGAFKIEELFKEFQKQHLDFEDKIDLAVSNWCFRHLSDPVGTFQQVFNLLRPKSGFLLLNGFFFLHPQDEKLKKIKFNERIVQLFLDIKAPFLYRYFDQGRSLSHFLVQRPDAEPCKIPMNYVGLKNLECGWQVGSKAMTILKRQTSAESFTLLTNRATDYPFRIHGDKKIHEFLKQKGLFQDSTTWQPMRDKEKDLCNLPLHRAIIENDVQGFKLALHSTEDINESDSFGFPALHLAIKHNRFDFFLDLLKKGANLKVSDGEGFPPLHLASSMDTHGRFVQKILDQDKQTLHYDDLPQFYFEKKSKPLDVAIEHQNLATMPILLEAGAIISPNNRNKLVGKDFSQLHTHSIVQNLKQEVVDIPIKQEYFNCFVT